MNILITQRIGKDKYGEYFDYLENNYINYFNKYNINPILLPNKIKNIQKFYKDNRCTRIILTGGENINPELYGKKPFIKSKYFYSRDKNEIELLKYAEKKKIPLLALCRGFQLTNVFFGGKLNSNVHNSYFMHKSKKHKIKFITPFEKIFGKKTALINSYHKQGVSTKNISKYLIPIAVSNDNRLIELYKHINLPIVGVQWHLERRSFSKSIDHIIITNFLKNKEFK